MSASKLALSSTVGDALSGRVARLVDLARWSPTVENCQEWLFTWDGRELHVDTEETRGNYFGTHGNTARVLSLGFVLHHLEVAAGGEGLDVEVRELKLATQGAVRASLRVRESPVTRHPLQDAIRNRYTDRRSFADHSLNLQVRNRLTALSPGKAVNVSLVDTPSAELADRIAAYDVAFMTDRASRERFLAWTRYSVEEVDRTRDGVYCRAWNISPSTLAIMKRAWLFECGNLFGALHAVKRQMAERIRGSSLVVVSAPFGPDHSANLDAIVEVGKAAMSAWLTVVAEKYVAQPLLLAPLAAYHAARRLDAKEPSAKEAQILDDIGKALAPLELGGNEPLCIFRVGRAPSDYPADWRSRRLPLERVFRLEPSAHTSVAP